ncbi:MAG: SPOR domain-containing protein [Hydrogenophaga sp.]|nr:SPOR domain-containing protein [Hydrogenophaga sp.]
MLKWAVWLLLLANAGYFFWSQGYLGAVGAAPSAEREPERLQNQVRPEVLRLLNGPNGAEPASQESVRVGTAAVRDPVPGAAPLPAGDAAAPTAGPVAPRGSPSDTACWQAGGFTANQADGLRGALSLLDWPAGSWQVEEVRSSGRWVVYMGRFDEEQMARKKTELRDIKIEFREVNVPSQGPGLALGTFSTQEAAEQGLQDLTRKGVRTARVAQERPESVSYNLRLPAATPQQRLLVESLGGPLAGRPLRACD